MQSSQTCNLDNIAKFRFQYTLSELLNFYSPWNDQKTLENFTRFRL